MIDCLSGKGAKIIGAHHIFFFISLNFLVVRRGGSPVGVGDFPVVPTREATLSLINLIEK